MPTAARRPAGTRDGADVVDSGLPELTARRRRARWAAGLLVLVLGVAGWLADTHQRQVELAALSGCATRAEAASADARARVAAMTAYVRPSLGTGLDRDVETGLYRLIADQAAKGEPAVRQALDRCRAVQLLPFHAALRRARTAYLVWLAAEVERLAATARDGGTAFGASSRSDRLHARAVDELATLAPPGTARRSPLGGTG